MFKSGKTPQEFIQYCFSPQIAVLSSPKVDNIVSKNNVSFVELLQPFTLLDWEGQFRDPTGSWCTVKNWKLNIRDVHWKPLQPTEARKQLNNAVILNYHDKTVSLELGNHKFDIPQSTLWFDAWRETYFEVQFPSDHEYTKHFLSCMLVATSMDDNIIDTYNSLLQQLTLLQNVTPPKLPKWFNNDVLKTYILLHDPATGNKDKAQNMFEMMQQTFGVHNCFILTINSKSTSSDKESLVTDLWAPYITHSLDIKNELLSPGNMGHSSIETGYPSPITASPEDNISTAISPEDQHPLTTNENYAYDNANSLQNNSFSGSVESVSIDKKGTELTVDGHGGALSTVDVDALKQFIKDFASKALLPYFERQILLMSDVVANRKGVSRSLLSATKRWFGTGKGGTTTGNNSVIYSNDCPELQLRRLGDLWFMCGQWHRAFDTYHTAKREFYADGAWLCYAGALEMAAISAFMAGEPSRKTYGYIEESITTYLNTCRMVQYAVRATLLSVLCLNSAGLYGEAAKQLIRMTSEDSDLRSAMLLEQAALSFISGSGTKGMYRKYAFHMVLAGHRFSKAGQKKHAYRCYKQAYQIFEGSGWRLSCDHVQFALGRLAGALRRPRAAARWLAGPLAPRSPQPAHQQRAFLREYAAAHQRWAAEAGAAAEVPAAPLPLALAGEARVLSAGPAPLSAPRRAPASSLSLRAAAAPAPEAARWARLERALLEAARGAAPVPFRASVDLHTSATDNSAHPAVPRGEPIQVSIPLMNPLKIPLTVADVELLWRFLPAEDSSLGDDEPLTNEPHVAAGAQLKSNIISSPKIDTFTLDGESQKDIIFSITAMREGELHLQGLAYKLSNGQTNDDFGNSTVILGKQVLEIPKKYKANKEEINDKRLQIKILPCSPCLQMTFSETPSHVISGELRTVDVEFRNVGPVDMMNLHIAISHPECISIVTPGVEEDVFKDLYEEKYQPLPDNIDERAARGAARRRLAARHVRAVCARLPPGAAARAALLLRPAAARAAPPAPPAPPARPAAAALLHLLAYYDAGPRSAHRLLRHTFRFDVADAVQVAAIPRRYVKLSADGSASETMSLSVEVKNAENEKDATDSVEILEASLLSRQWKFTDFILSKHKADALELHEKLHLIMRARRISDVPGDGKIEWSSLKINSKHPEAAPNITELPYSKFVTDYKTSMMDDDIDAANHDKALKSTGLIQSSLVIRWKMTRKEDNTKIIGQSYLWLDCFSNATSCQTINGNVKNEISSLNFEDNDNNYDVLLSNRHNHSKDSLVLFRMEHANNLNHDFKQRKLCIVSVDIYFVNCYNLPVDVFMNLSSKRNGSEVGWAGALSFGDAPNATDWGVAVSLAAFETRRVRARALCSAPGTYLVGAAAALTAAAVTQYANSYSVLTVTDLARLDVAGE